MSSSQVDLLENVIQPDNIAHDAALPYVFEPLLPEPSTRLLTLAPGTGQDQLGGCMKVCRLVARRHLPTYQALSYCWGADNTKAHAIIIDGKVLRITANAYNALASSRSPNKPVHLWIDQICINQEDLEEKTRHIRYMRNIYRGAKVVVAYLGEETEHSEVLFAFMKALEYEYLNSHLWWKKWRKRPIDSPLKAVLGPDERLFPRTALALRQYQDGALSFQAAHTELLKRAWFRRMWIVQEAGLARKLLVRVGTHTSRWEGLCAINHKAIYTRPYPWLIDMALGFQSASAIDMLIREMRRRPPWTETLPRVVHTIRKSYRRPAQLLAHLKEVVIPTKYIATLQLLRQFRHQLVGEESDKIFALMGLAQPSDTDRFLQHAGYSQTLAQNCKYFALMHMLQTGTLDVLSATCYGAEAYAAIPSWCPDWAHETCLCDTGYALPPYGDAPHRTGTKYAANLDFLRGSPAILVRGVYFDDVESVVEDGMTVHQYGEPSAAAWASWTKFAMDEMPSSPYPLDRHRWDAYWRTLVYNVRKSVSFGNYADDEFGDAFKGFLDGTSDDKRDVTSRLVWKGRKLYRTRRGYLGNGCNQVTAGDKIYICHGARFPFILRETTEVTAERGGLQEGPEGQLGTYMGHHLVGGDTYIHGICDGEGLDIAEKERLTAEMVCLS